MNRYMDRLSKRTKPIYLRILQNFFEFCNISPDEAIEWQKQHIGDYRFVDLALDYLRQKEVMVSTKHHTYATIKGFFLANRAPLPKEKLFFKSDISPTITELSISELKTILAGSSLNYRAAFMVAFQAGLGANEVVYVSNFLADHVFSEVKKGSDIIRLDMPGRKSKRNIVPYYTFIGSDAINILKQLFESRCWTKEPLLFLNQNGDPLSVKNYITYFHEAALRTGVIKRKTPKCPECGKETVHKRVKRNSAYFCVDCQQTWTGGELGRNSAKVAGIRYRVRSHELRDLFRTEFHRAQAYNQADPTCAEFFMGHSIDPLNYDKIMRDRKYALSQYRRALPWLNVLSEDPRVIDRSEVEDQLESQRVQAEVMSKKVVELERKLKVLNSPELRRLLKQLEDS